MRSTPPKVGAHGAVMMRPETPRGLVGHALAARPQVHPLALNFALGLASERVHELLPGLDAAFGIVGRDACRVHPGQLSSGANPGFGHGTASTRQTPSGSGSDLLSGFGQRDGEHETGLSLGDIAPTGRVIPGSSPLLMSRSPLPLFQER